MITVDPKLVEIALTLVDSVNFEKFTNVFLPALIGLQYVPLGGIHDGGADGFEDASLYEGNRVGHYFQISIQENHKAKIKRTIKRLIEVGRKPKYLTYVTAQTIRLLDLDQESLSEKTDVFVRIRDAKWIIANINASPATKAAFESYLRPHLAFLGHIGGATFIEKTPLIDSRTVCVFLEQEVTRRSSNSKLIESVSDSLILWALEDTDPDKKLFATRNEILVKIEEVLPSAKHFVRGVLDTRLRVLASKGNPTGREIRWYQKDDLYCLPYETRKLVEQENIEDETLKAKVLSEFEGRSQRLSDEISPRMVAHVALRAIELTFEAQGLELSTFLEGKVGEYRELAISDRVDVAIEEGNLDKELKSITKEIVLHTIRGALYESTKDERLYFSKLSRTYSLLFSLRVEPRIVEYFQSMASGLILLVGTDILIRALSERYLREEDQMTCNLLRMLKDAGADLVLTQPVAEEVHSHFKNTDREFDSDFRDTEKYVGLDVVRHSSKILIRAYFYTRLAPISGIEGPTSWGNFIEQICNYSHLHRTSGGDQVRKYLAEKFGMRYVTTKELEERLSHVEVEALTDKLVQVRVEKTRVLAVNDAKMVLAVYAKRRELGEEHKANPFGYRTWWLTQEIRVTEATRNLVRDKGSRYLMRPEFLVNFLALSPSAEAVRGAYKAVFPTMLGIKLSSRLREDLFHGLMRKAKEVMSVDEARAKVMMEDYANKLKGDLYKVYEVGLG